MRLHKAGNKPIFITGIFMLLQSVAIAFIAHFYSNTNLLCFLLIPISVQIWAFTFFRYPDRSDTPIEDNKIYSAADGKVVLVEHLPENDVVGKCVQISVFMSIYNVHLNYVPISGEVVYSVHKAGKHILAEKPKASMLNEQAETVIKIANEQKILIRQIAGAAAQRVLTFVNPNQKVNAGDELGFIRFGSRVDILVPSSAKILVKAGDKVIGRTSVLAEL